MSNIYVISDSKRPENEGKVFLFSYGQKIFQKLMNAINPEFDDEVSFNPFDFWEGAAFKLKIRNFEGYRNYDKSEFNSPEPLFEDDNSLEDVWKKQYPLKEFKDPSQFKSYEEIERNFLSVTRSVSTQTQPEEDEGTSVVQKQQNTPSTTTYDKDDADDNLALFNSLLED